MFAHPLKLLTTLLAALTSLIALVVLIFAAFLDDQGGPIWLAAKVLSGMLVLAMGVVTVHRLWASNQSNRARDLVVLGGAAGLVPLGGLTVLTTIYLAMRSGDIEWYMVLAGLAMICQGFLTFLSLWTSPRAWPTSR